MFARYAIALGHGAHRHHLRANALELGLSICAETPELLLVAPKHTGFLVARGAVLVGQLFTSDAQPISALPEGFCQVRSGSELRKVLDGRWGNYALFFGSAEGFGAYREPSGSVPVYRLGTPGQTLFVSDAELAAELQLLGSAPVDKIFAVHWLQYPFLRTRRTGIESVVELLAGTLSMEQPDGSWRDSAGWHPAAFVQPKQQIDNAEQAAAALRSALLACVPAQVGNDRLVLRLSGGLDSSIIAACLAHAGKDFECINFSTNSPDGDERRYAREVAGAFALHLQEIPEPPANALRYAATPTFKPGTNPLLLAFERAVHGATAKAGARLLIDGGGGDNIFCSITSAAPALDALASKGFRTAASAMWDIADRANCTIWQVGVAAAARTRRRSPWGEDRSFLNLDRLLAGPEQHPWLQDLRALPGKRDHVHALVHIQHFLDRGPSRTPLLHPLLCQPLLELCLRIPSWLWVREGRDRAVARDAFDDILPASVIGRRTKGSLQSMFHRAFASLRTEMEDLLVSGELARAEIVDTQSISSALQGDSWTRDDVQLRVSEMIALELWLRSWCRSNPIW